MKDWQIKKEIYRAYGIDLVEIYDEWLNTPDDTEEIITSFSHFEQFYRELPPLPRKRIENITDEGLLKYYGVPSINEFSDLEDARKSARLNSEFSIENFFFWKEQGYAVPLYIDGEMWSIEKQEPYLDFGKKNCPECGYPMFKQHHENFHRCNGCEYVENKKRKEE